MLFVIASDGVHPSNSTLCELNTAPGLADWPRGVFLLGVQLLCWERQAPAAAVSRPGADYTPVTCTSDRSNARASLDAVWGL